TVLHFKLEWSLDDVAKKSDMAFSMITVAINSSANWPFMNFLSWFFFVDIIYFYIKDLIIYNFR
ncbi:MAG: hypothetical protein NWQ29_03100, partial [Alphaproteobacteria bacterium]|nr:hypothetical protein [Alphaproteobacteria bacterium]